MKKFISILMFLSVSAFVFAQETEVVENVPEVTEQAAENVEQTEEVEVAAVEDTEIEVTDDTEVVVEAEKETVEEPVLSAEEIMKIANEKYEAAKERLKAREEEINAYYVEKFRSAATRKETIEAEVSLQRDLQAERDAVRLLEDEVYMVRRTAEENAELETKMAEFDLILQEKGEEFAAKNGAEEKIANAEQIKTAIWTMWEDVKTKSEAFNAQRDAQAKEKIDAINNAPFSDVETDSTGEPTRTALQRRTNLCNEELNQAKTEEEAYLAQLHKEIAASEKTAFTELSKAYFAVDTGKYETNSFTDDIVLRIGSFNGDKGYWKVNISSCLFEHTGLLDMDFELTYEEVTGKKFIPADKMTEVQFAQFKSDIALYDHIFRINSHAVYAKLNYEIIHWKEASEYRFIPRKLELIRAGDFPKTIHKETRIQAKNFIDYSSGAHEVRTEEQIRKDGTRTSKIVEKEQKKAGTYNPAYSYNANRTDDYVNQQGRGAFVITAVTEMPAGTPGTINLDSLAAELTFGIGKFGFAGADFGIQVPFITEQIMEFGVVGGVNCRIGKYVRPYIKATVNASTTYYGMAKAGAGIDFTFGLFMLNIGYDYSWNFDFNNNLNPAIDKSKLSKEDFDIKYTNSHRISVGVGFTF